MPLTADIQFPSKLSPLFTAHRYKVVFGGRGSGKSWGVARALLLQGIEKPLRILCCREIQKSIKDSVHRLLADQVVALGLEAQYHVYETEIRGTNGTEFLFSGLSAQTSISLKSYEGIDRAWVEEAQNVSKKSWDILTPTIRKAASEIWITFNPVLDTDETYQRFVVAPPTDSVVIEMNYHDNPWFPPALDQERLHTLATSEEDYANIWGGQCRTSVAGAIYAREIMEAVKDHRICAVPYDPRLKVHTVWDLGWNDSTSILCVQRGRAEIRIVDYIEEHQRTLDYYAATLNARPWNWGFDYLPHDGFTRDYKTGRSAEEILRGFGRTVQPRERSIPSVSVEEGIRACRMFLAQVIFDQGKTARLVECLKRYRRSIPSSTGEPASPLHDEFSHGADAMRYLSLVASKLTNEDDVAPPIRMQQYIQIDQALGALG